MREVSDLDDRAGMIVLDEKGRATARTARRRRDSLGFFFHFSFNVDQATTLVLSSLT